MGIFSRLKRIFNKSADTALEQIYGGSIVELVEAHERQHVETLIKAIRGDSLDNIVLFKLMLSLIDETWERNADNKEYSAKLGVMSDMARSLLNTETGFTNAEEPFRYEEG